VKQQADKNKLESTTEAQLNELLSKNSKLEAELSGIQDHVIKSSKIIEELQRVTKDKDNAETELKQVCEALNS
jgi:chaperonin cofactor prefoldin